MSAKLKAPRQSRKAAIQSKHHRRRLLVRIAWGLAGIAVLVVVGNFLWNLVRPKPGQSVQLLARTHIDVGAAHEPYNSDPPTSGPHYAQPATGGFYDAALPDETLVHNLEHGYVVIWYKCSSPDDAQCQALKAQIKDVMNRAGPVVITTGVKKLIAVPRPKMDAVIALTSWGRIDKLSSFTESEVMEFINDFRLAAPEPDAP